MSYPPLPAWVMDALRKGWTPELIEGRLKVEWPDDPRMRMCFVKFLWAVSAFLLVRLSGCF